MSETEYGVKAPELADGTLLLQEQVLTPRQTSVMKDDREAFLADHRADKRDRKTYRLLSLACIGVLAVNIVVIVMSILDVLPVQIGSMTSLMITFFACFIPLWAQNWANDQARQRRARQFIALSGDGASVPLMMTERFVTDREQQRRIYVELLTQNNALIVSPGAGFRITLDTANDTKFVVRVVQGKKAFATP